MMKKPPYKRIWTAFGTVVIFAISMPDKFLELYKEFMHSGLTPAFAVAVALWASKEVRNKRLDRRDARWECMFNASLQNDKIIMERLEVGEQWSNGLQSGLKQLPPFSNKLFISLRKETQLVNLRRKRKMNQNTNFATLLPGLAGVIKLILQSFGLEVPDQHINDILNGVAALAAVIAVFMSHRKAKTATTTETKSTTTETTTVQPVQSIENGGNQIVDTKFTVDTGANK